MTLYICQTLPSCALAMNECYLRTVDIDITVFFNTKLKLRARMLLRESKSRSQKQKLVNKTEKVSFVRPPRLKGWSPWSLRWQSLGMTATSTLSDTEHLRKVSAAFLSKTASRAQPWEETEGRPRKAEPVILTGPGAGGLAPHPGPRGETPGGSRGRRQDRRALRHGLSWGFCRKDKGG